MEFSIKDTYRAQVEAITGGKNTVMYDDYGNPNIMVEVNNMAASCYGVTSKHSHDYPLFYTTREEIENTPTGIEVWIAKYAASRGNNNLPSSREGVNFWTNISFDEAKAACKQMGKGWHLTSNYEWLSVVYNAMLNGTIKDVPTDKQRFHEQFGMKSSDDFDAMKTGMFGSKYSSTGDIDGVMDLAGTVWQWVDGLRLGPNWDNVYYWGIDGEPANLVNDEIYTTYKTLCIDATPVKTDNACNANVYVDCDKTSTAISGLNIGGMNTVPHSDVGDDTNYERISRLIGIEQLPSSVYERNAYDPYTEFVPIRDDKVQPAVRGCSLHALGAKLLPSCALTLSFCTRNKEADTGFRFSYIGKVSV